MPPAATVCVWSSKPFRFSTVLMMISVTPRGLVKAALRPFRSAIVFTGLSFFDTHTNSPMVLALSPMMRTSMPCLAAAMAAGSAISATGNSLASMLRTDVPPPWL